MKILLMGNPNVGKSVVFSRLTGTDVIISNYPGATVEFSRGRMKFRGEEVEVIDVPGTYTLEPTTKAEEVASKMLKEGNIVINVLNATNLESNLYLTLQLLERRIPMVVALNMWDEAKHKGIDIDVKKLEKMLGVPVIPTVALTGEGVDRLVRAIPDARAPGSKHVKSSRWKRIGDIVRQVQRVSHRHHTLGERISDITIKPETGIPVAIAVLLGVFLLLRIIGEGLISFVFNPLFGAYEPLAMRMSEALGSGSLVHSILIGNLIEGRIDFMQSMGLLTTGIYVPLGIVLPYVISFYLLLGLLEDTGYLPRLGVLVDTAMHRMGMHGLAVVPMLLGFGCNVPGALSTRILESRKQRFIAMVLLGVSVPCMAQLSMVFALLGPHGVTPLLILFATLFMVWACLGLLLNRIMRGGSPEIFTEIPPYRRPYWGATMKKLWMRIRHFFVEAIPFVLFGVFLVNVLYFTGVMDIIGRVMSPIVVGLLGLPPAAAVALVVGFLRKDVAVGMLLPLGLSVQQILVASVVLVMYFPCVATFSVFLRELGIRDTVKASAIMLGAALLVGAFLRLLLQEPLLAVALALLIFTFVVAYLKTRGGKNR
ncbi:MAG: ferrous iron transporter B [Candidatus Hadarchaeales archaeon]